MVRALWVGLFLFFLSALGCALALGLMKYYNAYELGLIFPVTGVACMFLGEKLLQGMEVKLGNGKGGAGAVLMRSLISSLVVVAVPTLCWGGLLATSDVMALSMEAAGVPRDGEAVLTVVTDLHDQATSGR